MIVIQGKSVSQGICRGQIYFHKKSDTSVMRHSIEDCETELQRYEYARKKAGEQLRILCKENLGAVGEDNSVIFNGQEMILEDIEYNAEVHKIVRLQRVNVEYAVRVTADSMAEKLKRAEDAYIRERAQDVLDVSDRLLRILLGEAAEAHFPGEPFILAAEDLMPSEVLQTADAGAAGIVLSKGSQTSHAVILAKSRGIPTMINLGGELSEEFDGEPAVLDSGTGAWNDAGYHAAMGCLYVRPDAETLKKTEEKIREEKRRKELLRSLRGKENVTREGKSIRLFANVGNQAEAEAALENDAGGIGLLRSEILYLEGDREPEEETQFLFYKRVLETMGGKEVVIRTMDIGADKNVPYLNLEREDNPAMGMRAIRLCLERPELFKTQLRALYRASVYGSLSILYPMITSVREVRRIRELESRVRQELTAEGKRFAEKVPTGIMIETPAAALLSEELAPEVDFFSVGTNDLAQYVLALDRQNERLDAFEDPEYKAVFKLIEMAAESAHRAGIPIGVCGEMASDITWTSKFIEMGIDELSVAPGMILELRKRIREI